MPNCFYVAVLLCWLLDSLQHQFSHAFSWLCSISWHCNYQALTILGRPTLQYPDASSLFQLFHCFLRLPLDFHLFCWHVWLSHIFSQWQCADCYCLGVFEFLHHWWDWMEMYILIKLNALVTQSLSIASPWIMAKSYSRNGHCSLGVVPHWKHHTSNLPRSCFLSNALSKKFRLAVVSTIL